MQIERIVVVGAGAMGSFFAARLAETGTDVTLIDVDDVRLALIASDGILIDDNKGVRAVPMAAARAEAVAGFADLLIVFTKGAHTAAAIGSVTHLIGSETRALTLQNGVGNAETIAGFVPPERVLMGITDIPCDLVGPNSVASHGHGQISLGAFQPGDPADGAAVTALLNGAGLTTKHDPDVRTAVWEKIAFNAAMNALCTVANVPVGGLDNAPGRRLIDGLVAEVVAVAHASAIPVNIGRIVEKIEHALANHVGHKPSMLQDRLAGRQTEIETINGAVVRAGEAVQVPAPINRMLADIVRMIEVSRSAA